MWPIRAVDRQEKVIAMAEIHLDSLAHSYAPNVPDPEYALKPLDMTWEDGETYALLGPSGCGKSTMLNIISGLVEPSQGRVRFDGEDVTQRGTAERNIAQVFQVPVIYRSMTVAENLSFPLVCRKWSTARVRQRVGEVAELLGLDRFLRRPAAALTADQKQLVSLGRGLVRDDVSALLLDEPLTVIDPQLKFELRRKLKEVNHAFNITMVLVTHDQNEAMTFARNVIVMNHGEVIQQGDPQTLFENPRTEHVGYFIGSPAMNFIPAEQGPQGVHILDQQVVMPIKAPAAGSKDLKIGFRPEHVSLTPDGERIAARVMRIWFEGLDQVLELESAGVRFRARLSRWEGQVGDDINLWVKPASLRLYQAGELVPSATAD